MARPKQALEEIQTEGGYTVLVEGKVKLVHHDLCECLQTMRTQTRKAELYRNSDKELLAYTTGPGFNRRGVGPTP